jgi:hypothetical protein
MGNLSGKRNSGQNSNSAPPQYEFKALPLNQPVQYTGKGLSVAIV